MTRNFEICDKNISNDDQNSLKISRFRRNLRRIIRAQRSTGGARLLVAESDMWLSSNPSLIFGGLLQIRLQSSLAPFFRHFAIRVQSGPADSESMNLALVRMIAGCGLSPSIVENHAFHSLAQEVHFQTDRHLFIQKKPMEHTCSLPWMILVQCERSSDLGHNSGSCWNLLADCAKFIFRTSEVSDDGLDRKGLSMLLQG